MLYFSEKIDNAISFAARNHKRMFSDLTKSAYTKYLHKTAAIASFLSNEEDAICAAVLFDTFLCFDDNIMAELTECFGKHVISILWKLHYCCVDDCLKRLAEKRNEQWKGYLMSHMQSDSFGIVSMTITGDDIKANREDLFIRNQKYIQSHNLYFHQLVGGYGFESGEVANEFSFIVFNISVKELIDLGKEYGNKTVLYKKDDFRLLDCKTGNVLKEFNVEDVSFDNNAFKNFLSQKSESLNYARQGDSFSFSNYHLFLIVRPSKEAVMVYQNRKEKILWYYPKLF